MKMSPDYFAVLKAEIESHDTSERRARYLAGDFPRSDKVQDLDKRYCWDLFWEVQQNLPSIPPELNDNHIATALKRIIQSLGG